MKNKELVQLLKYSSPYSIWVVTYYNKLLEIKCPFTVKCLSRIGELKSNKEYEVALIKLSTNLKVVFVIQGKPYYYYHFDILL